jgi:3D (Asp-Asp-Asp) domain-containing protein
MKTSTYLALCVAALIFSSDFLYDLQTATASPKSETVTMNVSAYCPGACCCGDFADGITADGHVITTGDKLIAAPPEYAFGTTMTIPGYGTAVVRDRGGAIKGNKIDLLFDTHQLALEFGRQELEVIVHGERQRPDNN